MPSKTINSKNTLILALVVGLSLLTITILSFQFRTNGKIISSGRTRKFLIYVPESYDPEMPTPLVFSIHGFVQWPNHQRAMTGWNDLADEYGFLVVYPQGTGFPLRWNASPIYGDTKSMDEELQFFADLIDHLERTYNIDPSRVYANGMSNGAGMTDLLACELSDRFAGVGGVAGAYLFPQEDCHPSRPVPVIAFHGVDDPVVPYLGGPSPRDDRLFFPAVEDWAKNWALMNSCDNSPEKIQITEDIMRMTYSVCEGEAPVIFYRVEGAGHTWPGGEKLPVWITGPTNRDINASALMWEFFSEYPAEKE